MAEEYVSVRAIDQLEARLIARLEELQTRLLKWIAAMLVAQLVLIVGLVVWLI